MSTCPVSRGLSHRTGVSVAVAPSPHGSDDADLGGAPGPSKPGGRAAVVSEHIKHIRRGKVSGKASAKVRTTLEFTY